MRRRRSNWASERKQRAEERCGNLMKIADRPDEKSGDQVGPIFTGDAHTGPSKDVLDILSKDFQPLDNVLERIFGFCSLERKGWTPLGGAAAP